MVFLFCKHCGMAMGEISRFCPNCGAEKSEGQALSLTLPKFIVSSLSRSLHRSNTVSFSAKKRNLGGVFLRTSQKNL